MWVQISLVDTYPFTHDIVKFYLIGALWPLNSSPLANSLSRHPELATLTLVLAPKACMSKIFFRISHSPMGQFYHTILLLIPPAFPCTCSGAPTSLFC